MTFRMSGSGWGLARLVLIAGIVALACDNGPGGPGGPVEVSIRSPAGNDAAALVEVVGAIGSVEGPDGGVTVSHRRGDTLWVFVALVTPGQIGLTLETSRAGAPAVRLLQVADADNRLRALDGYRVEVRQ